MRSTVWTTSADGETCASRSTNRGVGSGASSADCPSCACRNADDANAWVPNRAGPAEGRRAEPGCGPWTSSRRHHRRPADQDRACHRRASRECFGGLVERSVTGSPGSCRCSPPERSASSLTSRYAAARLAWSAFRNLSGYTHLSEKLFEERIKPNVASTADSRASRSWKRWRSTGRR